MVPSKVVQQNEFHEILKSPQEMPPFRSAIVIWNIRHSMDLLFTNQANTIGTHPESFQQNPNSNIIGISTFSW